MIDRIYNTVVDDITRKIKSEGYTVLESAAYVQEHQPKYIVWANIKKKRAIMFAHNMQEEYFALRIAEYSSVADYTKNAYWLDWYTTYYEIDDLDEQEVENIIYNFLDRYEDAIRRQSISISKLDKERNLTYPENDGISNAGKKILLSISFSAVLWMAKKLAEDKKYKDVDNIIKQMQYPKGRDSLYEKAYRILNEGRKDSLSDDGLK